LGAEEIVKPTVRLRGTSLVTATALLLIAGQLDAEAQAVRKVPTVGYLSAGFAGSVHYPTFVSGLRDLGYVDGQTVAIESRYAEERLERLPALASDLAARHVDVIVAVGGAEAAEAKRVTDRIPIVTIAVDDPVGRGLVASLSRPGGNVTGLTTTAGDALHGKRLELLKELAPGIARVGILADIARPGTRLRVNATAAAARILKVELREIGVRGSADLDRAFDEMRRERIEALIVPLFPMFFVQRGRIVDLATRSQLPTMYDVREYVDRGGLVAYGPSFQDLFRRASVYVDKIIKGATPGDLPIEQPTKFELVINLKTAKALGLTIPPSLFLRVDQVIE
jgi:putative tryptophan/tyrosine transport system substrate-binding protein